MLSIIFFWPVPLLPTQILWVNLITDSLPAIALGVDPGDKAVMKYKPRNPKESFFAQGAGFRAILGGTLIGILSLLAFYFGIHEFGYRLGDSTIPDHVITYARTMSFVVLSTSQLFYALSIRNFNKSIREIGLFSNKLLILAIVVGFILQVGVISIPFFAKAFNVQNISIRDWMLVIGFSLVPLTANEVVKFIASVAKKEKNK